MTSVEAEQSPPPLVPASPRELKGMMRDWRAGRATRNLWEAFHDAYIVFIAALMLGAMVVNVVLKAQRVVASCDSASCLSARTVLPWAALTGAVALALAVSRLFGPVVASAAEGFWLLDAPISRVRLLAVRLVAAVLGAFGGGAAIGAATSALTGSGGWAVLVWAVATGLSAAGAVAFAAAQQGIEKSRLTRAATYVFGLVGVAALLAVVSVAAGWLRLGLATDLGSELGLVVAGFGGAVLVASAVLARLRLGRIRRARLTSGGSLVSGLSGAFFALDIGLARDIVVARRAIEVGHVRSAPGRGVGLSALVWREWSRLRRFPQPLVVVAGTVVVPYASDALGMSTLTPLFGALALFAATIPMLGGLRVLTRTGGLARCLPFAPSSIKLAAVTVPAMVVALWMVAVTGAFLGFGDGAVRRPVPDALAYALVTAVAGLLGAIRWTQAKGVDFGAPMISTQAGAFPPGLMTNLFRGFDMVLLITAPVLLGLSPIWSLLLAAIVAAVLLNSMDAESLRAKQAEQQKLLEAQRRQREAEALVAKQRKR